MIILYVQYTLLYAVVCCCNFLWWLCFIALFIILWINSYIHCSISAVHHPQMTQSSVHCGVEWLEAMSNSSLSSSEIIPWTCGRLVTGTGGASWLERNRLGHQEVSTGTSRGWGGGEARLAPTVLSQTERLSLEHVAEAARSWTEWATKLRMSRAGSTVLTPTERLSTELVADCWQASSCYFF